MSFTHRALVSEMGRLEKFALKLCRNRHDAEDLLQATVLKALEKKHMYKEDTNLFSWVSKIMYNDFVSAYRRKVKFESRYDGEKLIINQAQCAEQIDIYALSQVKEAMNLLSDEHRTVLVCVCIKGMKYQEVADMLGTPVGTVRSRLSRARDQLQEALEQRAGKKVVEPPPSFPSIHHHTV